MRYLILLALLPLVAQALPGQNQTIRKFYRQHKHSPESFNATIPGPLVWLGTSIAKGAVKSPEEKILMKMARKFGTTKVLYAPEPGGRAATDVKLLVADLQTRNGYEPFVSVTTGDARVYIMGKENGKKFKRFLVVVEGADGITLVSAKARLKYARMGRYINQLINYYRRGEAPPDEDPPLPKAPKVARKNQV